jgi:hypothetical protein
MDCHGAMQNSSAHTMFCATNRKRSEQMTQAPKKQDKPSDPPYSGGEDETVKNSKIKPGENEPPVDESDEGP